MPGAGAAYNGRQKFRVSWDRVCFKLRFYVYNIASRAEVVERLAKHSGDNYGTLIGFSFTKSL